MPTTGLVLAVDRITNLLNWIIGTSALVLIIALIGVLIAGVFRRSIIAVLGAGAVIMLSVFIYRNLTELGSDVETQSNTDQPQRVTLEP